MSSDASAFVMDSAWGISARVDSGLWLFFSPRSDIANALTCVQLINKTFECTFHELVHWILIAQVPEALKIALHKQCYDESGWGICVSNGCVLVWGDSIVRDSINLCPWLFALPRIVFVSYQPGHSSMPLINPWWRAAHFVFSTQTIQISLTIKACYLQVSCLFVWRVFDIATCPPAHLDLNSKQFQWLPPTLVLCVPMHLVSVQLLFDDFLMSHISWCLVFPFMISVPVN